MTCIDNRINIRITTHTRNRLENMALKLRMRTYTMVRQMITEQIQFYEDRYFEPERDEYIIRLTEREVRRLRRLGYSPNLDSET